MTGLIAFLLRMSATVIAVLSRTDELVDGRRPRRVSVLPLVFALAVTGALMDAGFKGAFDQRRATTPPPVSPVADPSAASAPMYPGPPSGAPLPKLDLLIVFDYGPGPRHPTPGPGPPSLPQASPAVGRLPPSGVPPRSTVRDSASCPGPASD
jgi:hypothetical protein